MYFKQTGEKRGFVILKKKKKHKPFTNNKGSLCVFNLGVHILLGLHLLQKIRHLAHAKGLLYLFGRVYTVYIRLCKMRLCIRDTQAISAMFQSDV